jgi:hypothetical protein
MRDLILFAEHYNKNRTVQDSLNCSVLIFPANRNLYTFNMAESIEITEVGLVHKKNPISKFLYGGLERGVPFPV